MSYRLRYSVSHLEPTRVSSCRLDAQLEGPDQFFGASHPYITLATFVDSPSSDERRLDDADLKGAIQNISG